MLPGVGDILRLLFLVGWSGVDIDDDGVRWRWWGSGWWGEFAKGRYSNYFLRASKYQDGKLFNLALGG